MRTHVRGLCGAMCGARSTVFADVPTCRFCCTALRLPPPEGLTRSEAFAVRERARRWRMVLDAWLAGLDPSADLVSTVDAARILGTSDSYVRRLARRGRIRPAVGGPLGGGMRFARADVLRVARNLGKAAA